MGRAFCLWKRVWMLPFTHQIYNSLQAYIICSKQRKEPPKFCEKSNIESKDVCEIRDPMENLHQNEYSDQNRTPYSTAIHNHIVKNSQNFNQKFNQSNAILVSRSFWKRVETYPAWSVGMLNVRVIVFRNEYTCVVHRNRWFSALRLNPLTLEQHWSPATEDLYVCAWKEGNTERNSWKSLPKIESCDSDRCYTPEIGYPHNLFTGSTSPVLSWEDRLQRGWRWMVLALQIMSRRYLRNNLSKRTKVHCPKHGHFLIHSQVVSCDGLSSHPISIAWTNLCELVKELMRW